MDKRIEAYLDNLLSEKERGLLEEELKNNAELAEELAFYLSIKKAAENRRAQRLEERHREWQELVKDRKEPPLISLRKWLAAAAITLSLGLGWVLLTQGKPDLESHSSTYITQHFDKLSTHMNAGQADSLQLVVRRFNEGDLQGALSMAEHILERNPDEAEAQKLAGIVSLRLKDYDKAIEYFRKLSHHKDLYGNPGKFYQALTLLQLGGKDNRKQAEKLLDEVVKENLEGKKEIEKWQK